MSKQSEMDADYAKRLSDFAAERRMSVEIEDPDERGGRNVWLINNDRREALIYVWGRGRKRDAYWQEAFGTITTLCDVERDECLHGVRHGTYCPLCEIDPEIIAQL